MAKEVWLMPVAEADLENIIGYLLENWGINVCENFLDRFEEVCSTISTSPAIYPMIYKKEKIRKCVLTHQNIIYFREGVLKMEIITIFDSRQDTSKLSKLLKDS